MQSEIPNCFYRVSIKGLILNETRSKFLISLEDNGMWKLPGGGLDWGETAEQCLKREIREELGLTVTEVNPLVSYCLVGKNMKGFWTLCLIHEIKVQDLNFTSSEECQDIKFVSPEEISSMNAFRTVKELGQLFDLNKHGEIK